MGEYRDEQLDVWRSHEHTRRLHREYEKKRKDALANLLAACAKSDDPEVREYVTIVRQADVFLAHLSGGDFRKEQSDV